MKSDVKFGLLIIALIAGSIGLLVVGLITASGKKGVPETQLETVEHDGHKFIRRRFNSHGVFVHHPDCPCGITKGVERP